MRNASRNQVWSILILSFGVFLRPQLTAAQITPPRAIEPNDKTGSSAAVIVGDWPLVHTAQLLPELKGADRPDDILKQIDSLFQKLNQTLEQAQSDVRRIVKLNVYLTRREFQEPFERALAERFAGRYKPAVTFAISSLPAARALVAADAVATTTLEPGRAVQSVLSISEGETGRVAHAAISPRGTRIYIAGQAESDPSIALATRRTLGQLAATLEFVGGKTRDVVHLKAFITPMTDAAIVQREISDYFKDHVPPVTLVEWQSDTATPVEIELVVWGGMNNTGEVVEFLTPPHLKASPIYSRIARIHHTQSIFISGLEEPSRPKNGTDLSAHGEANAEQEVSGIFATLERILNQAGSDFKHLVKATYYVGGEAVSRKLNELRPRYYDPARPPSASKALMAGAGRSGRGLTMDMIAVPAWSDQSPEYGPPEFGYGLSADEAAAGWISLFDGKSTFGWSDATVADGAIRGGRTNAAFGPCELRIDCVRPGTISIAGRNLSVPAGKSTHGMEHSEAVRSIKLIGDLAVRQIAILPSLRSLPSADNLTGWKRIDHPSLQADRRPEWTVRDGAIHARGGPGCIEFIGPGTDQPAGTAPRFGNFILQLDVRTNVRHANAGVFFRAIPGDFMNGYEAQVFNRAEDGEPGRPAQWSTGGIDDRQNARRLVSRDRHFFKMTAVAHGPHIATWVNGYQQTDWLDRRAAHSNPRQGLRVEPGTIQLQAHDRETDVEFRNIRVGSLDGPVEKDPSDLILKGES